MVLWALENDKKCNNEVSIGVVAGCLKGNRQLKPDLS